MCNIKYLIFTISVFIFSCTNIDTLFPVNNKLSFKEVSNTFIEEAKAEFQSLLPEILRSNHAGGIDIIEYYIGDLTNDKEDDLAIYYSLVPGEGMNNGFSRGIVIYKNDKGTPKLIKKIEPDYLFHIIGIHDNILEIEKLEYSEFDGRCCPSIKTTVIIKVE